MKQFFRNPNTGLKYDLSVTFPPGKNYISTPNLLAYARNYYDCQSMLGMPIDAQDPDDSHHETHWERYLLQNEIMTGY